jgi:hypothetical protein
LTACLGFFCVIAEAHSQATDIKKAAVFQVPYRLTETMHLLVRAKINGKGPFNFIVDTGAPALYVATEVGKELSLAADKNGWAKFDRFEIEGGVVVADAQGRIETPFQLEGMNGIGLAGATLHGIIGYTVLARYRMEIDFTQDKMVWTTLDFKPPPPVGLGGKSGAMGGLDALGGIMKMLGGVLGAKADPIIKYRGFFGAELADVGGAVEVRSVLPNGPADRAGLKVGDKVTHLQAKAVSSVAGFYRHANGLAAGETTRVGITRDGSRQELKIELGEGL